MVEEQGGQGAAWVSEGGGETKAPSLNCSSQPPPVIPAPAGRPQNRPGPVRGGPCAAKVRASGWCSQLGAARLPATCSSEAASKDEAPLLLVVPGCSFSKTASRGSRVSSGSNPWPGLSHVIQEGIFGKKTEFTFENTYTAN